MGATLAPGLDTSVPLVSGLVGGGQVKSKAQVSTREAAQHQDKSQQEDNPWEGQEQVLNKKDGVNNLEVSKVINVSL